MNYIRTKEVLDRLEVVDGLLDGVEALIVERSNLRSELADLIEDIIDGDVVVTPPDPDPNPDPNPDPVPGGGGPTGPFKVQNEFGKLDANGYTVGLDNKFGYVEPMVYGEPRDEWFPGVEWRKADWDKHSSYHTLENITVNGGGLVSKLDFGPEPDQGTAIKHEAEKEAGRKTGRYQIVATLNEPRLSGSVLSHLWLFSEGDSRFGQAEFDWEHVGNGMEFNIHYPTTSGGKESFTYATVPAVDNLIGVPVEYIIERRTDKTVYIAINELTASHTFKRNIFNDVITEAKVKEKAPDINWDLLCDLKMFPFYLENWSGPWEGWMGPRVDSGVNTVELHKLMIVPSTV